MKTISNADARTIISAAATLSKLRPADLRSINAIRRLRVLATKLSKKP